MSAVSENLLRELAPQVLGAVIRRFRDFSAAEDAVQEALLAAAVQWPLEGVPDNPRGWLIQVAARRMTDHLRTELSRRRREGVVVMQVPAAPLSLAHLEPSFAEAGEHQLDQDDTLILLFMCCHPALTRPSAIALTLRAVGGLTTAEIANAFMVPEATMAQRISRAKRTVSGVRFDQPGDVATVLRVLYLVFNEGYAATGGDDLIRRELCDEAIRLGKLLAVLMPDEAEALGLVALMLFHDSRREARTTPEGELILLEEQDRSLWNRERIEEGGRVLERAARLGRVGPYQLQAAIAATHAQEETDWPAVAALYEHLARLTPSPVVELNRAVAVALAGSVSEGLDLIAQIEGLDDYYLLHAARADLLRRLDRRDEAATAYERALALATNPVERAFLERRLSEVA